MHSVPTELANSILDAAPDAILIVDSAGIVRLANRQASELFGYPHDELVGTCIEQFMPERFRGHHVSSRATYARASRVRPMGRGLELFGRRKDGVEFPVEISLSPVGIVGEPLVVAAVRDASERKRFEKELVAARVSADRANQAKSRFLATASHDLRQPLQSLALLNGTLRRIVTDTNASEALVHQEQAITAMARLLNALLDIGKLESGAVRPEPKDFSLGPLLDELRREFGAIAASKGLDFEIDSWPEPVYSDPALVEQILRNLVSNAIKYTANGYVNVRCVRADTAVAIAVRDSGVGIPQEHLAFIYDEFYQVGVPTNASRNGYGLGLSIVQRLVKLLGLELTVRSEVGRGSTFTLNLPAGHGQATDVSTTARRAAPAVQAQTKKRILLVEDDAAVRAATRLLLSVEGFDVVPVASLGEALAAVREHGDPDLLITDFHLQDGETGTAVITSLRQVCRSPLKAILVTGDTSSAIRELPRDPNVRLASKPVEAEELVATIRSLLAS